MSDGRDDDPVEEPTPDEAADEATDVPETDAPETEAPATEAPETVTLGKGDAPADDASDAASDEDDADDASDEDDASDQDDADGEPVEEEAVVPAAKSGPPPRPSKDRGRKERSTPKRPSGPKGSRKAKRRRFGAAEITALVSILLFGGQIALISTSDSDTSGWAWILLATLAALVVWSITNVLEKRGKLAKLRNRGLAALIFVLALAAFSITTVIVTDSSPELGLDLQGGFSVVLSAEGNPPSDSIDQAMEIIRNRIDGLGVAEPEVTRQGDNVVVDLPGIEDRQRAQEILGETARLEFRPVLQTNLPYDAEAAAAGEDPCAEGAAALAEASSATTTPADTTVPEDGATTVPEDGSTTAPADGSTTAPASTEAPADDASTTTAAAGDEEGATPAPAAPAVPVDGEYAAPPLRQQETTTTTAAEDETTTTAAEGETTTTAAEGETTTTVAGETTTTTAPADPAAQAANTIVIPDRPDPDAEPVGCTQVGPAGFEGGALSKSRAELGGQTGSEWVVTVAVKGSQKAKANELINACAGGAPNCPANPLTGAAAGAMAIVLDGEVISAPTVNEPNLADGDFVISGGGNGGFEEGEAKDLALKLRYGALPVEFTRSAERQVSPTLGEDSLQAGILAGVIGLIAVALYLLVYYRALGLVVVVGLGVWSALMFGTICWFSETRGLTLSLAGVVGIVVSLGTTVDSYVVYFERLKDEVRMGKSVRASTEKGFQKAFKTIVTADLASLMGAALLWWLTVGAVRGFAFFLGLSVVLDLIVAYCFSRPVVALLARSRFFTEHRYFGVARGLGRSGDAGAGPRPTAKAKAGAPS